MNIIQASAINKDQFRCEKVDIWLGPKQLRAYLGVFENPKLFFLTIVCLLMVCTKTILRAIENKRIHNSHSSSRSNGISKGCHKNVSSQIFSQMRRQRFKKRTRYSGRGSEREKERQTKEERKQEKKKKKQRWILVRKNCGFVTSLDFRHYL